MKQLNPKFYIRISEVSFIISSSSFLFIPKSSFRGSNSQQALAYMVSVLFWIGLLVGLCSMAFLDNKRRKAKFRKYRYPGVICFFRNKKAKICDFFMILSLVAFLFFSNVVGIYHNLSLLLLALSVLLIYFHSILNGNNYAYAVQKGG